MGSAKYVPEGLARRTCYGCGRRRMCVPGDASGLDGPSDAPGCRECLPGAFERPPDKTCARCGGVIPGDAKLHPRCRLGSVETGQFCYTDPFGVMKRLDAARKERATNG